VCVFEDDVVLCPGFRARLTELEFPDDWQIIYLGCTIRKQPTIVAPGVVRITDTTWSTHAMIIRADILPRLHRLCAPHSRRGRVPDKGPIAVDNLISSLHRELKVYAAYPFLAWQAPGKSEIDAFSKVCWDDEGRQTRFLDVITELDCAMAKFCAEAKEGGG
jgi:GR25 family glycosyltransferase involved in LPS biosynthesis